jgi:hypothetical protein
VGPDQTENLHWMVLHMVNTGRSELLDLIQSAFRIDQDTLLRKKTRKILVEPREADVFPRFEPYHPDTSHVVIWTDLWSSLLSLMRSQRGVRRRWSSLNHAWRIWRRPRVNLGLRWLARWKDGGRQSETGTQVMKPSRSASIHGLLAWSPRWKAR